MKHVSTLFTRTTYMYVCVHIRVHVYVRTFISRQHDFFPVTDPFIFTCIPLQTELYKIYEMFHELNYLIQNIILGLTFNPN